jgi:hypothetical protein
VVLYTWAAWLLEHEEWWAARDAAAPQVEDGEGSTGSEGLDLAPLTLDADGQAQRAAQVAKVRLLRCQELIMCFRRAEKQQICERGTM